jgi:hypothetical protein
MLWDLYQEMQIQNLKSQVRGTQDAQIAAQQQTRAAVAPMEERLDKLALICQAMWSLIEERTNLTEADLQQRVTELDLKDGQLDGKYSRPPVQCPKCGAMMSRKFRRCLFCGEKDPNAGAFDTV